MQSKVTAQRLTCTLIHSQKWELGINQKHSNIDGNSLESQGCKYEGSRCSEEQRLELLAAARFASGGKWRTSCQGYDFKHVTAWAAPSQGNRLLKLQQASHTRVPLTHAMVYWSGLWVVACCSGALRAHTSHCQSVFCLNPQTSPFSPAIVSNSVQTGCFWLPTQVIGTFSLNL